MQPPGGSSRNPASTRRLRRKRSGPRWCIPICSVSDSTPSSSSRALSRRATESKDTREVALTPDDVQAWLGVLNDTRLVLGTRLGVTEEEPDIDPDAPEARGYAIYYWLTALQGDLIDMLL